MRTRRFARAGWALTAALAVALTGCQSLNDGVDDPPADDGGSGDAGDGDSDPGGVPAQDGAPVLELWSGGGFVPMGWDFSQVPALTVYDDGTAIVPGPQIAIYPGPLLPNLQVEQLDAADVDAIVAAARDAGLLATAPDYGMPNVTDVPTTYVTITVDGTTYEHAAYALGIVDGEGTDQEGAVAGPESGLTEEQAQARIALAEFIAAANGIVGADGDATSYAPTALAMFAQAVDTSVEGAVAPDAQVIPWPVDTRLADAGECTVVDGDTAQALLAALATANQATLYEQDGVTYGAWFRPLLPHETGCDDLG